MEKDKNYNLYQTGSASCCRRQDGFTLIELLVVIAIIGVLAAVILGGLKSAREKGADNAIKAELKEVPAQMEIYASNNNYSFRGACTQTNPESVYTILVSVAKKAHFTESDVSSGGYGNPGSWQYVSCNAGRTKWAIDVPLINPGQDGNPAMYCIDSSGFAGERTQPQSGDSSGRENYKCPAS